MGQPSVSPLPIAPPPLAPSAAAASNDGRVGGCQVRCAGCKMILTVGPGLTEFMCPTCQLPQMLPPELMPSQAQQPRISAPAHGIDPTKIQLPYAHCKAILNAPHGITRFSCPQCGVDLAVDLSKIRQFFPSPPVPAHLRPPPPPEEVNEGFPLNSSLPPSKVGRIDEAAILVLFEKRPHVTSKYVFAFSPS